MYLAGVGYNWIDGLKEHCDAEVTDKMFKAAAETFPHDPPKTKEAYLYRQIFENAFGKFEACQGLRDGILNWVPLWSDSDDPSGRVSKFHAAAYSKSANGAT